MTESLYEMITYCENAKPKILYHSNAGEYQDADCIELWRKNLDLDESWIKRCGKCRNNWTLLLRHHEWNQAAVLFSCFNALLSKLFGRVGLSMGFLILFYFVFSWVNGEFIRQNCNIYHRHYSSMDLFSVILFHRPISYFESYGK